MSTITNIINPLEPVIGKEMAAENFKWDGTQYKLNIDPASNVVATEGPAGTKLTVAPPTTGNITAMVSNVSPTTGLDVGGLYRFTMPANTDVRIQAIGANRQAWITSEGEYPGGSFTTSTSAIVNVTVAPIPADNNIHVAGELNRVTILDVATSRIFIVTVWRMGAIGGNWSGWVEEVGATSGQVISVQAPIALSGGGVSFAAPYVRAVGRINIGDFNTAAVIAVETTPGITAAIVSGAGASPMILQVNLAAGLVPDAFYKVMGSITSNPTEAALANATVIWELAAKTAASFRVVFRETGAITQNCNFEFALIK